LRLLLLVLVAFGIEAHMLIRLLIVTTTPRLQWLLLRLRHISSLSLKALLSSTNLVSSTKVSEFETCAKIF
jgi:hypothetical protein